jgi:hypothetical protein
MNFTKEQLSDVFVKHIERDRGLQDLMELMIESTMTAERRDFLDTSPGNKGIGFRQGKSYQMLNFKRSEFKSAIIRKEFSGVAGTTPKHRKALWINDPRGLFH